MTYRRAFLAGTAATLLVAGCGGPAGPGNLTVRTQGSAGMNPGPDGTDRPLTVTVVQLTSPAAFDTADYFALQTPSTALGPTLLKANQIVVQPGASGSISIPMEDNVAVIGVIAGYRDPAGKIFRAKTAAPAEGDAGIVVSVTPTGVTVAGA